MKSSIGSLAALAALSVAPSLSDAAPVVASFSNVAVPELTDTGSIFIDVDNNGSNDFEVYANFGSLRLFSAYDEALQLAYFVPGEQTFGTTIGVGDAINSSASFFADASFDVIYAGLSFRRGADTHMAWLRFDSDFGGNNFTLSQGAWESVAGASIAVGAIPEPSAGAALAGLAALGCVASRRSRPRRAEERAAT